MDLTDDSEKKSAAGEGSEDVIIVSFELNDTANPKNWTRRRRWYMTFVAAWLGFNASFASAAPSSITTNLMHEFNMSQELATLTISLFIFGYCVGPLFWGPLSEQYGRRPIFLVSLPVYMCFQIGCALSHNIASMMCFRILSGMFAAAPMSNSGAVLADIWDAETRGVAIAIFLTAPFMGPLLGSLVAGYISQSVISWRWLFWITTLMVGTCVIVTTFTLPETYGPVILMMKARRLRSDTGDSRYTAPIELLPKMSFLQQFNYTVTLPFKILMQEPALMVTTLYMSFLYGCMYLMFEAFPVVFVTGHHFTYGQLGLSYIPVVVGFLFSALAYLLIFYPRYRSAVKRYEPEDVPPEIHLDPAIWGSVVLVISFFWFGWTSLTFISFWAPLMSGFFMGFASIWIFLGLFNYTVDVYHVVAASALAGNAVIRSIAAAGFPLFATQMYVRLSPQWASTVLAFCALLMLPITLALKRYGPAIRRRSKFLSAMH